MNASLAMKFFEDYSVTQLQFRKKLVHETIHNRLDVDGALTRSLTVEMEEEKSFHKFNTCLLEVKNVQVCV